MLQPSTSPCVDRAALPLDAPAPPIFFWLAWVGWFWFWPWRCVSASVFLALGRRGKSRRAPPSGPRFGDPSGRPHPRRISMAFGRVGDRTGFFDWASCPAKKASHPWLAPCGPDPSDHLACATGPEGGTHRLFPRLRLFVGEQKAGFRFVAGNARLPFVHGFIRPREVEGSRTSCAPTTAGDGCYARRLLCDGLSGASDRGGASGRPGRR
jgi:hypothetical protein